MNTWTEVIIRPGTEADLEALTDMYNGYIRTTAITFDTEPLTVEARRPWLLAHPETGPHRLLVATVLQGEGRGERLLGYATSGPFRPKAAYSTSVEVSVYCAPEAGGRGIGTRLYEALFEALEGEDVHRAYAGVTMPNEASVRLHARFGFTAVGIYHEVGRKFGRYHDVAWFEKRIG
ncbi:GNAT family N-acetyltransferase [Streptomyces nitrosporeus]|uniref:N-acetyltransferase family protein n=1 Tax=Streptomyces nitrosporeus TaxID=28894 RepID=A0A5J6FEP7_9ACTN|nr:GNAT family N-acetyltransferase [Streptomyces nitrosporeus]QEU73984.1 N-acetyltransferase family protein [Streptomyces nitrosporeus]GGZ00739.1 phosphinothricin N-acetyltransferase [Streptomyces nitrosporeus]